MALSTMLVHDVADNIRARGKTYYARGAVRIVNGDAEMVEAVVRGTQRYEVTLTRESPKRVSGSCTCPFFADNLEPCKHMWATLLAAEARGYLGGNGTAEPTQFIPDPDGLDDSYDGDEPDEFEDFVDNYDDDWEGDAQPRATGGLLAPFSPGRATRPPRKQSTNWKQTLNQLAKAEPALSGYPRDTWPPGRELIYIVDVAATLAGKGLMVEVAYRERKKDGSWKKPRTQRIPEREIARLPDPSDRRILGFLRGAREYSNYGSTYYPYYSSSYDSAPVKYILPQALQETLLALMCQTGRCRLRVAEGKDAELHELTWDDGPPWEFWVHIQPEPGGKRYQVLGELRRGNERQDLTVPILLVAGGPVFWTDRAARLEDFGAFPWISLLRAQGALSVPAGQLEEFLKRLFTLPQIPRLDLPEELHIEEVTLVPRPRLKVKPPKENRAYGRNWLLGELAFDYDGNTVLATESGGSVYEAERRRRILRDLSTEQAAMARLRQLGFREQRYYGDRGPVLELAPSNLPRTVRALLEDGWLVEAEGKLYRRPGAFDIQVTSGIDWFDLTGTVDFEGTPAHLPALLAALRKGETAVRLDDGTFGLLPEEWLKKYGLLAGLGTAHEDSLRFSRTQVGLLDALLAAQPEARWDEEFARARDALRRFEGVSPADAPAGFVGELRGYQRDGLGWLLFLQDFGFGGCLADDMGLGKTVQVLALLETRRALRATVQGKQRPGPSLAVVPRSLIFNWIQEAARFTPQLRVLDHTGVGRLKPGEHFDDYDLILTTYGTLRRDAAEFKDVTFDYAILDEAQAIKNAKSESAKAARLLRAHHRLAMSGTPIENHLGELWSLFEFLNPGMLGTASVFQFGGAGARTPSEDMRALLARALRPFILRRTKQQVAKDLPPKLEQTIYCELEREQRTLYDELREHYRMSLLGRLEREDLGRMKIQVLEALLRLRQAACHPGLLDKKKAGQPSAKLDVLLPQLTEVTQEGHKALVFSQFTSFLALVRERLDREQIPYEYLDGRTRNRAAKVERFQTDPECKLFLISLKAGGLGLNLTAAEYVFLLDPWWNPAVEAQAIDRSHRIGQTQQVFAYRLIARDTVEEKVLQLQQTKRDLADAILSADNSLIRDLKREDLELLLS